MNMTIITQLKDLLTRFVPNSNYSEDFAVIDRADISLNALVESLIAINAVILQNENESIVCRIKFGFANLASAYIACRLVDCSVYAVSLAPEGIIKQKLAKRAIRLLHLKLISQ